MNLLIVNTTKEGAVAEELKNSFAKRFADGTVIIEDMSDRDIKPCVGCNFCWLKTPGECAVKDGYEEILPKIVKADKLVFITENSFGFVSCKCKNAVDRLLPLATMYLKFKDGQMRHVSRYKSNPDIGFIYLGDGDKEYLNRWCDRVNLNFEGESLGAYPREEMEEMFKCM